MSAMWKKVAIGAAVLACNAAAGASDLTLHLNGSQAISRSTVKFECDAQGVKMGLPAGVFSVEYLNGAGNSLAVVPVGGSSLVFANVISGSGARYAAKEFIWWDAGGRGTTFSSDSIAGKMSSACHRVQ
jgi:membrane-bound inhibitor of C-type lysozyme